MYKLSVILIFAIMLTACTSSEEETSEEKRTIEIADETYEVPENPERIVTDYYAGELLTVDANVVGTSPMAFDNPFLEEQLAEAVDIGDPLNVESILELEPDLIVVMYDENLEQLNEIAPTVFIPYNTATAIEDVTQLFGELVGEEEKAEQFLAEYEEQAAAAKDTIQDYVEKDATFAIYEITDGNELYVFGENFGRGGQVLYNALDLNAPTVIEEEVMEEDDVLMLSQEVIPEYAADYMFITSYDPESEHRSLEELEQSSVWQGLDAVQNDNYRINDFDTFYPYDPISITGQIDLFVEMITEMEDAE